MIACKTMMYSQSNSRYTKTVQAGFHDMFKNKYLFIYLSYNYETTFYQLQTFISIKETYGKNAQ